MLQKPANNILAAYFKLNYMSEQQETKKIIHHVFFTLKNPDSVAERDKLIEGIMSLHKIESIRQLHIAQKKEKWLILHGRFLN